MRWFESLFTGATKKPAPIIEDYPERGTDKDYRRPDDPEHVIRINQNQPKGCPRKLEKFISVAGVSQEEYRTALEALIAGKDRQVTLERDPDNPHGASTIKVIGYWSNTDGTKHAAQIGWIPSEIAAAVVKEVPERSLGATIDTMYKPRQGLFSKKSAGIRISIWGPRRKTTR